MPLKYLIDENLRGKFTRALMEKGLVEGSPLDIVETGEPGGPISRPAPSQAAKSGRERACKI